MNSAKFGVDYMADKLKMTASDAARKLFEISRRHLPDNEKDYLDKPIWLLQNRKCMADIIIEKALEMLIHCANI